MKGNKKAYEELKNFAFQKTAFRKMFQMSFFTAGSIAIAVLKVKKVKNFPMGLF